MRRGISDLHILCFQRMLLARSSSCFSRSPVSKSKDVSKVLIFTILSLVFASSASSTADSGLLLQKLHTRIKNLKFSWDLKIFEPTDLQIGGKSVGGLPLTYWTCGDPSSSNRSLILAAVHGDEVTPVYFGFKAIEWLKNSENLCKNKFVIVAPIVNPDGFLRYSRGTRTNYNKVDINRNFDTPDWAKHARQVWKSKYSSRRRYFPGDKANSEPETQFQKWLISHFKPTKILSIHAPLNILDYDGPVDDKAVSFMQTYVDSCEELKKAIKTATPDLRLFAFGNFPGSLGNYAGKQRGIPTITTELPSTNPRHAQKYFAMMEKGTRTFLEFELRDSPSEASAKTQF